MIVIREKSFGQVKRENKAKKKAWEVQRGENHLKKYYQEYLDEMIKFPSSEPLDLDKFKEYKLDYHKGEIGYNRAFKNDYNEEKVKSLPKVKQEDVVRKFGRRAVPIGDKLRDKALNNSEDIQKYIYKPIIDRRKFDKFKGGNERDLADFFKSENVKNTMREDTITQDPVNKKSSTPFVKRVKRLFKKNINKLIK